MEQRHVIFKNNLGKKIDGILHIPAQKGRYPAIIFSHGFTGFKDQEFIVKICKSLCRAGFVVLRFDFVRNPGESETRFEDMTVTQEVRDLRTAVDFIEEQKFVNKYKIGLTGHSLGGFVSTIVASIDNRIRCLVDLSPAFSLFGRGGSTEIIKKDYLKGKRYSKVYSKTLKKNLQIKTSFYKNTLKYKIEKFIKDIHCPLSIIFGKGDFRIIDAKKNFKLFDEPKEFEILNTKEHTYKTKRVLDEVIRLSVDWFKKYLAKKISPVVNCFVHNKKSEILILKRSKNVGHYKGDWFPVGGYLDEKEDPIKACKREIVEETGIRNFKFIKKSKPFRYYDKEIDKIWIINPLLFKTESSKVKLDWEHTDYKWIKPTEIKRYKPSKSVVIGLRTLGLI